MISNSQGEFIIWINAITAYENKYAHLSFLVLGFHLIFSYNTYIFTALSNYIILKWYYRIV